MLVEIDTSDGKKKIRVCDYCRTVCIPHGSFCSSRCYHANLDAMVSRQKAEKDRQIADLMAWEAKRNGG